MSTHIDINKLFENFQNKRVLIVGDVMVDSYLWGNVERISPEAPVPVVDVASRENRLGGAANVALNIIALGAKPQLCSVVGNDVKGNEFIDLLKKENISESNIIQSDKRITTTKFRVFGNNMQMLRVDEEIKTELDKSDQENFFMSIQSKIENNETDVILFQDYDKGVLSESIISRIIDLANKNDIPTIVDPKKNNFLNYNNVTVFKPNLKELSEGLNRSISKQNKQAIIDAVDNLHEIINNKNTLITLSEEGVYVKDHNMEEGKFIKAFKRSISDVSGAGDTVVSVAALCLASKVTSEVLAMISNLAGGLVCEVAGVAPIEKEVLKSELQKNLQNENND